MWWMTDNWMMTDDECLKKNKNEWNHFLVSNMWQSRLILYLVDGKMGFPLLQVRKSFDHVLLTITWARRLRTYKSESRPDLNDMITEKTRQNFNVTPEKNIHKNLQRWAPRLLSGPWQPPSMLDMRLEQQEWQSMLPQGTYRAPPELATGPSDTQRNKREKSKVQVPGLSYAGGRRPPTGCLYPDGKGSIQVGQVASHLSNRTHPR